jgi:luciferase family oxidoreductase group 1
MLEIMSEGEAVNIPLSVLDIAPVWEGSTPAQSLREMTELAQHAERLGYQRYWVAEHHNTLSIASSSPPVLVATLAGVTGTIRVGSGGVMLTNHPPLVVAEQFGTLEALHPGRIDLGVGRAPGTDPVTARLLHRDGDFSAQLQELMGYFDDHAPIDAIPARGNRPSFWLLGSSVDSAELAGKLGLPYAFAHHIRPENTHAALARYRETFQPSAELAAPRVIVSALVIAADTQDRADWLATPLALMIIRMRSGFRQDPHTPPAKAATHPFSPAEREFIRERLASRIIGDRETVRRKVIDLVHRTQADELMVMTLIHDQAERLRSYELLAEAAAG